MYPFSILNSTPHKLRRAQYLEHVPLKFQKIGYWIVVGQNLLGVVFIVCLVLSTRTYLPWVSLAVFITYGIACYALGEYWYKKFIPLSERKKADRAILADRLKLWMTGFLAFILGVVAIAGIVYVGLKIDGA